MFVIQDKSCDAMIGPFDTYEDAASFIAKVEDISGNNINSLEMYGVDEPNEWLYDNMDDILMANC